jgi:hypothetical protein
VTSLYLLKDEDSIECINLNASSYSYSSSMNL